MRFGKKGELARSARKLPKFLSRKTTGDIIFDLFNMTFLLLFCFSIIYPFWSTFLLSFSNPEEATTMGFRVWINEWTLTAYKFAFSAYGKVPTAYVNSIFRTVFGVILILTMTLLASYPLSKKDLPGRKYFTIFFLITMFFSGGLIPRYFLIRNIGLFDTRWALIFPFMAQAYYIIITRNFLMTIDKAYEESAFMDGANYLQILLRIIIPLSKPVIATIALWAAVFHWNEWFHALIYIKSESKIVLQVLLRRLIQVVDSETKDLFDHFMSQYDEMLPSQAAKSAVVMITIGPIVLLYPFLQKHFLKGIFIGSLKG